MATGYGLGFPNQQFLDNNGVPLAGGLVYTYQAGTSTPASTYTDSGISVPNANPIVLDSAGRCVIYLPTNTAFKFVFKTSGGVTVLTQDNISLISVATPPAPAAVPTGAILPYGASSAPSGYLLCDGTAQSRTTYAALFAVIGTTYGIGDGSSTFNMPDMRGRFAFGLATSGTGNALGATFGAIDHTHTGPSHTHTVSGTTANDSGAAAGIQSGSGGVCAAEPHTHTFSVTSGASGTGATGTANPPGLTFQFIVKTACFRP